VREREFRSESPRLSLTDLTNITQPTLEVKCDVPVEKVSPFIEEGLSYYMIAL
jgi:hypothetical protein